MLEPVASDLWIAEGAPVHPFGLTVPIRMTVIRLHDGSLLLHSPVQHSAALAAALLALGPVRYLLAPSFAHWMMLPAWQAAFPEARTLAAPNMTQRRPIRRAGLRIDGEITEVPPEAWRDDLAHVVLHGGLGFAEVALLHVPTRTAILTDLVQNLDPDHMPRLMRLVAGPLGMAARNGQPPVTLRTIVRLGGAPARAAAARIVAWQPERVIFSHGDWYRSDGAAALARALSWLTPGD